MYCASGGITFETAIIERYVDGIYLRRSWGGEYKNVAILVSGSFGCRRGDERGQVQLG